MKSFLGLMGLLVLGSLQPENRAEEQSSLQASAAFGPPNCTPFSISQNDSLSGVIFVGCTRRFSDSV